MKGKIIVIEGTDCSGKQTQSELLVKRLNEDNVNTVRLCFPRYDTPTGKIIAGPYLGKPEYGEGFFYETASNVSPYVASLYFAADRKYNIDEIKNYVNKGINVILDRYTESNMAHQGGKIEDKNLREKMFSFIEKLEYELLELPRPDYTVFLHLPYESALLLKQNRKEKADQHELSEHHLRLAEEAYLALAKRNEWVSIECVKSNEIKSIEQINDEVYTLIKNFLNK